jgi:hypothetical protein
VRPAPASSRYGRLRVTIGDECDSPAGDDPGTERDAGGGNAVHGMVIEKGCVNYPHCILDQEELAR